MAARFSAFFPPVMRAPSSMTKSGWVSWSVSLNMPTRPMKMPRRPRWSIRSQPSRILRRFANSVIDNGVPEPSLRDAWTRPVSPAQCSCERSTRAMTATSSPTRRVEKSDIPVPEM